MSEAEAIRRNHLKAEVSIRSIGNLYLAIGILWFLGALVLLQGPLKIRFDPNGFGYVAALMLPPAVVIWIGWELRWLSRIASWAAGLIGASCLLVFPIGTFIGLAILGVLFSPKGLYVVSPGYRQIIARTPQIRSHISTANRVLLGILAIVILYTLVRFHF